MLYNCYIFLNLNCFGRLIHPLKTFHHHFGSDFKAKSDKNLRTTFLEVLMSKSLRGVWSWKCTSHKTSSNIWKKPKTSWIQHPLLGNKTPIQASGLQRRRWGSSSSSLDFMVSHRGVSPWCFCVRGLRSKLTVTTNCWFQPPNRKICSSNWVHLPQIGMNIKHIWEPPPRNKVIKPPHLTWWIISGVCCLSNRLDFTIMGI